MKFEHFMVDFHGLFADRTAEPHPGGTHVALRGLSLTRRCHTGNLNAADTSAAPGLMRPQAEGDPV